MKTDLTMDDDQLARFIDLLSDRYKEDTWQSLADMVINAGLHALESMGDEKDNHPEEKKKKTVVYQCVGCDECSPCTLTAEAIVPFVRQSLKIDCPLHIRDNKPMRFNFVRRE